MTRITLDANFASQLGNVFQTVELCDPSGKVLGRFVPAADPSQWEPVTPEVSEDELDRRERSNERRFSSEEVRARLERL